MKKKNVLQRTIIILIVTLIGIYIVIGPRRRPNVRDFTWSGIKTNLAQNIKLGLDLKGGSHLVMRVKVEEFLKTLTETNANAVRKAVEDAGQPVKDVRAEVGSGSYRIVLEGNDASQLSAMQETVTQKVGLEEWSASTSGNSVIWTLSPTSQRALNDQATEQAKRIIDSRLDAVGVAEPLVQRHGSQTAYQILVQMPGIQDPERVKKLLSAESKLELVKVVSPPNPNLATYPSEEEAKATLGGTVPSNRRVLPYTERAELADVAGQAQPQKKWVVVESPAVVDGNELRTASATQGQGGADYQISFALKPAGAQKFGAWTSANISEYMGVVLNDEVRSIAYIQSQSLIQVR